MWILFLLSVFIEDTVYVRVPFPYSDELLFGFPAFSQNFVISENLESILSENSSILVKDYGNLSSLSIRGTRTQDVDIELNGIPLKTVQNDYADVSILPSAVNFRGIIIKHPLSSYGSTASPGGGIFLNLHSDSNIGISVVSDRTVEAFLSQNVSQNRVLISLSQRKEHSSVDFSKFFYLFSGRDISAMFSARNARVSGPQGTLLKGKKREFFAGYSILLLKNKHIHVTMKGNASTLFYEDKSISDVHKSFYNGLLLEAGAIGVSFTSEYISSTKTANRERHTFSMVLKKNIIYGSLWITLNGSVFYEDNFIEPFTSTFVGVAKRVKGAVLYANFSKGVHLPSFFDLYWPEDIFARGNPELLPEYIFQCEAGLKFLEGNSALYLTFFDRRVKNMIQWIAIQGKYSPYNTGEHGLRGIEGKLEYHNGSVSAGFTGSFSFFDEILYYPHTEEGFYLQIGRFRLGVAYTGRRQKRPNSIKTLPPMEIVDIDYEKSLLEKINFKIGIRNLLDEPMEWIAGYPQVGREFYTTIKIKWR